MKTRKVLTLICALALMVAGNLQATTLYWDGGTADAGDPGNGLSAGGAGTWDTLLKNWDAGAVPHVAWNNGNNDIAVFGGTAGRVTLGEAISVGGLLFSTTGYTVSNSTYTLTFAAIDNTITLNNVSAATISRAVGGTGNVTLTAASPATAGTMTFNASSTGGWSGTTTVNPNMTMLVDNNGPTNQVLLNTSAITINGGAINVANILSAHKSINFINDTAPITFNGGGSLTWRPINAGQTFLENIGAVTNNSGQVSFLTGSISSGLATLVMPSPITRNDATSVLSFSTGNGGTLAGLNNVNRIKVTGAGSTAGWSANMVGTPIIGPWATTGTSSADYAVYTNDLVAAAAGANSGESTWTDSTKAYALDTGSPVTINTTRTITALRFYGAASTLTLGAGNLETYGLLFPGANAKTVASTGGALTTPAGGGNLFITTVAAGHTISAPVNNNGPVTLVKSGGNTLTLSSTTSTYAGGTVLNAGTLATTADANLGSGGGVTVNGAATWNMGGTVSVTYNRTLTINEGAVLTVTSGNAIKTITGAFSGNGAIVNTATTGFDFSNTGNTFTGTVNNGYQMLFSSLGDSANPINLNNSNSQFVWNGGAKTFALRPFTLNMAISASSNGRIINNGSGALTIQQNLALSGTAGARGLELSGSNASDNTFAGTIADGEGSIVSVIKTGVGKWILSGTNSYSGATTISAGTLTANAVNALGSGNVTVSGTTTLLVIEVSGAMNYSATLYLPSATTKNITLNADLNISRLFIGGVEYPVGTYTASGAGSAWMNTGAGVLTVGPAILQPLFWDLNASASGSGSATPANTWDGASSSWNSLYDGTGSVSAWTAGRTAAFAAGTDATGTYAVTVDGTQEIGGLTFEEGTVTLSGGMALRLVSDALAFVAPSRTATIATPLTQDATPRQLTKVGTGSLTLSADNSYSGGTLLSAGTLVVAATNALGTGPLVLGGGTIQNSDATTRTLENIVMLNGSSIVGGTGNLTFNNSGTGTVIAASTIAVTSGSVNATFGTSFVGAFGITKAGAGTMTLTGTNTYGGATTVSAGSLVVSGGQIANNAAVNVTGGNSTLVITNGANVFSGGTLSQIGNNNNNNLLLVVGSGIVDDPASVWDLGSAALNLGGNASGSNPSNNVLRVDGAGVYGGAVVTNVNGAFSSSGGNYSASYSSIVLTNGGHFFNKGALTIGNSYYSNNGDFDSVIIAGGAVNAMYYGSSNSVVVGDGIRGSANGNLVFVGASGVLTNAGYNAGDRNVDFVVGYARDIQSPLTPVASNRLVVTDGGKVFTLGNITVGYNGNNSVYGAMNNEVLIANGGLVRAPGALNIGMNGSGPGLVSYNSLTIVNGGQLYTGADSTVGRANNLTNFNNMAWVNGTNSVWDLGTKNLFVGTATGTGVATGNVFSVSSSGVATNISALMVSANNTLELRAGGQIFAAAVTNSGTLAVAIDGSQTPACGLLAVDGDLNVNNATLDVSISGTPSGIYVIASYGTLIPPGVFAATNGLPDKYKLEMDYKGSKQIAIVYSAAGTIIRLH